MTLQPLDLRDLDKHAENIYEAIVVLSKRARQINEEMKISLNQELETFVPKADSEEEIESNPEQERVSLEYERMPKPTQAAVTDMLAAKLTYRYKED